MRNIDPDSEENQRQERENRRYIGGLKLQAKLEPKLTTAYFTFGQDHEHFVNDQEFNRDTVVKITAEDPRAVMFETFGTKWSMQYDKPPRMDLFPGGIIEVTP